MQRDPTRGHLSSPSETSLRGSMQPPPPQEKAVPPRGDTPLTSVSSESANDTATMDAAQLSTTAKDGSGDTDDHGQRGEDASPGVGKKEDGLSTEPASAEGKPPDDAAS